MADDMNDSVRAQFSQNAEDYRDEPLFSEGEDLRLMTRAVALTGTEHLLDIGSGAGHTALAFASRVLDGIGCDVTPAMVQTASEFAKQQGVANVSFQIADAEHLPFSEDMFDVVTCRFAAHHFQNIESALKEVFRVLKPGGTFLLVDHYAPEDPELDRFVNTLDRMRDPSHVREHRLSEYAHWLSALGMDYHDAALWDLRLQFGPWIQRARTPLERQAQIVRLLRDGSADAKQVFAVEFDDVGDPLAFRLKCALIQAVKR